MHAHVCESQPVEPAVQHKELSSLLRDDLLDGSGVGGRSKGEGTYIFMIHFVV